MIGGAASTDVQGIDDDIDARDTFLGMFFDADRRRWDRVEEALADGVYLDYSSSKGSTPRTQSRTDVVKGWLDFIPGFDATHHHLTVVRSSGLPDGIRIEANGTTTHVLQIGESDSLWTVVGFYDARLRKRTSGWEIYSLTFHRLCSSGNERLYEMAVDRAANGGNA
jgi:hypothetical protein